MASTNTARLSPSQFLKEISIQSSVLLRKKSTLPKLQGGVIGQGGAAGLTAVVGLSGALLWMATAVPKLIFSTFSPPSTYKKIERITTFSLERFIPLHSKLIQKLVGSPLHPWSGQLLLHLMHSDARRALPKTGIA